MSGRSAQGIGGSWRSSARILRNDVQSLSTQKIRRPVEMSAATRHDVARADHRVVVEGISEVQATPCARLCGCDRFGRVRLLLRATNGHQRPAQKPVQGPCYKQACRTIFSLP
jgi:hypothetical protein